MNNLTLTSTDGRLYADSRDVSEAIERPHNDLLKSIRSYCKYLGEGEISQSDFFVEATYTNEQNREMPCYLITRKGCNMIANKLTGKKGVLFTSAYVTAFEQMHEQLTAQSAIQHFPAKATSAGEVSSLIKNVRITLERQESAPRKIAKQTELLLRHFGIPVIEDFVELAPWEQVELAE